MSSGACVHPMSMIADAPSRSLSWGSSRTGRLTADPFVPVRVLYVGGYSNTNSSNALNYGLSYVNANNSLTNANANIGSRPDFIFLIVNAASSLTEYENAIHAGPVSSENVGHDNEGIPMNRIGNLFPDIATLENVSIASDSCCLSRRDKSEVFRYLESDDRNPYSVLAMILDESYEVSEYRFFTRNEHGKIREIADLPLYPDRIIREAFAQIVGPALDKKFIDQTFASRPGLGIHAAVVKARSYIDGSPKAVYCIVLDVHHCYQNIDKDILISILDRHIKDVAVMRFLKKCIYGYPLPGISIGDRLSPIFCNIYLSGLDHYIKEVLKCHLYIRYADNLYVFGYSVQWLNQIRVKIEEYIVRLGLEFNPPKISDLRVEGVDFLGFRLFKDYTLLRKSVKVRMKSVMRAIDMKLESGQYPDAHDRGCIASYKGMLKWCDSYNLYRAVVWPVEEKIAYLDRERIGCASYRRFVSICEVIQ